MILSFTDSANVFQQLLCARYDQYFCFLSTTYGLLKNSVCYLNHCKVDAIECYLNVFLHFKFIFVLPFINHGGQHGIEF